ncbi:MAG TPA: hypothetical protein PLJ82_06440 [Paludibacteraceae bacterium]|nr:hypothetical protein [Paludibacteraceae bacterium]
MKKFILLLTIFILSSFVAFSAELPSKGYSGSSFSDGGSFMDEPTLSVGNRIGATNSVLGVNACQKACSDKLMIESVACGGNIICLEACFIAYTACMDACETYSLPIGSGFFFLLLLSGGYAGTKLNKLLFIMVWMRCNKKQKNLELSIT